jgi:hypothetical protein
MSRSPVYFYFRASWKRRRWHPLRFKRMLTPYQDHLCARIERSLGARESLETSFLKLIFNATAIANIPNYATLSPTIKTLRFLKRRARRPGHAFYAPSGTKLKPKLEVELA